MAKKVNITIDQGATKNFFVQWKDANGVAIDLTGYVAYMQFRNAPLGSTKYLDWNSTTNATKIIITANIGQVAVAMLASDTLALNFTQNPDNKAYYDLIVVHATLGTKRLIEGRVILNPSVTIVGG